MKKTTKVPRQTIAVVDSNGAVTRPWNEYFTAVQNATTYSSEDILLITLMLHAGLKALVV